jgi:hypothetical protein
MNEVQERIIISQNSIKVLEFILKKLSNQNESFFLSNIQKQINTYKKSSKGIKIYHFKNIPLIFFIYLINRSQTKKF